MHVYHRLQVHTPSDALLVLLRVLGLVLIAVLLIAASCSCSAPKVCAVYYRIDSSTVRPYYKAVECPGDVTQVECDDTEPLPNDRCR